MKAEVEMHLQKKAVLEALIPSSITIGPFWVGAEGVRQVLAKKRKALSNAVLELLATQLRRQADQVGMGWGMGRVRGGGGEGVTATQLRRLADQVGRGE